MRVKVMPATGLVWFSIALLLLARGEARAQTAEMKFQAFLLWGTNEGKPPEGKPYKPIEAGIKEKLKDLPLKWTNWFEVNRVTFGAPLGLTKEVPISEKCHLKVKKLAGRELEVSLIGKGKEVVKRTQALPKGEVLVLGGNAPNATAWLVVMRRLD